MTSKKTQKMFVYAATMVTIVALLGNNLSLGWVENSSDPESVDWWMMFRHDPRHSGYSTSRGPDTNNVLWTYKTGLNTRSSPAVAYGRVYVGSDDGKMYCLDAETGEKLWSFSTPWWGLSSSPAVAYGRVYFGGTLTEVLYCLDAETGEKLWSYPFPYVDRTSSSPVVVDDRVYIGGDKMYCLNATTGEENWNYTKSTSHSPAVVDGKVFFPCSHTMYCLSADNGEEIWCFTAGAEISSSPAVSDGRVYFGSFDRHVYCLDAETGEKIWSFPAEFIVTSSPAIAYGKVYIGSAGKLYCLDAETGEEIWSHVIEVGFHSSPAVADGKVYVGSKKMLCLDAYTGEEIWSYQADDYFGYSSPAIANGRVYIGCYNWRLYCFADPLLSIGNISGGFSRVCVELTNPGDNPARNISWNITIKGGVCGTINVTTMGSLASLEPGETMVVSTSQTIFGFGLINIMVTAVAENTKPVYKEKKGLVFGPFVFTLPW